MLSDDVLLGELDARLELPPRARRDLLREVGADLNDLVDTLMERGLAREAALERARLLLAPGDDAAAALSALHRSPHARMIDHLGPGLVRGAEIWAVLAMALLAATAPAHALLAGAALPARTAVPLLLLAGIMGALLSREALRWWLHRDADVARLVHSAGLVAGAVALALAWGALATAGGAWSAIQSWQTAPPTAQEMAFAAGRLLRLGALALGVAMLGTFGFLALLQGLWRARDLQAEVRALLSPPDFPRPRPTR